MDLADLNGMSIVELNAKIDELKSKYFYLFFKYSLAENKNLKEIRFLRKNIARLFTIVNRKRK